MYPPFTIAPAIAAVLVMTTPFTMQYESRWYSVFLTTVTILAITVPYLLEVTGVVSPTFSFTPDGLALHTGALRASKPVLILIAATYIISSVGFAGFIGYSSRQSERAVRRQLLEQSWHLRQLVR